MSVKKSNIYTKGGDAGETSLVGGTRIPKSHPALAAYGGMDELNSWLGLCAAQLEEVGSKRFETQMDWLKDIQENIFVFGSLLACEEGREAGLPRLEQSDLEKLEQYIDEMDECLLPLKNFILPGGSTAGACFTWPGPIVARWRGMWSSLRKETCRPSIWPISIAFPTFSLFLLGT